jgi:hypothetical protein
MSGERTPLAAAPGLTRTAALPPPPPRRIQVAAEPTAPTDSRPPEPLGTKTLAGRAIHGDATMRAVTLSLPASLVTQIKDRARADRVSQPDVLMDALSATRDRLGDLLARATTPPTSDGLFLRRPPHRTTTDPMATLSLRLLATNLTAIDELVTKHKASSRSALCATALREYLA